MRTCTGEGRTRAKAKGIKFGRKPKLTIEQQAYVARLRAAGEGVRQIASIVGVSSATIGRIPPAP
ncbi:helix-turn-helix domain-containing protein [Azorhizobium oxalatiphilum]|uniref:helix-turn-helix domain-containing protein n=1 Tax=Azorhizobium oxalatiphilum TaxID=980631 RepID=UPI001662978A|nr:helix-turn-helix domain-containing protein [Azorhizobium oxalatiphilum]